MLVISACLRDLSENNWGRGEGGEGGEGHSFFEPFKRKGHGKMTGKEGRSQKINPS